jgi:adenylosuccinate synthase
MLREAATVNGFTGFAINKLDVLSGQGTLQIATAYRIDGKLVHEFPMTLREIERAEPVYEAHSGWSEDLRGCRRYDDLPAAARAYVERVEALVGVPVELISVGPNRDETIARLEPFRPA